MVKQVQGDLGGAWRVSPPWVLLQPLCMLFEMGAVSTHPLGAGDNETLALTKDLYSIWSLHPCAQTYLPMFHGGSLPLGTNSSLGCGLFSGIRKDSASGIPSQHFSCSLMRKEAWKHVERTGQRDIKPVCQVGKPPVSTEDTIGHWLLGVHFSPLTDGDTEAKRNLVFFSPMGSQSWSLSCGFITGHSSLCLQKNGEVYSCPIISCTSKQFPTTLKPPGR